MIFFKNNRNSVLYNGETMESPDSIDIRVLIVTRSIVVQHTIQRPVNLYITSKHSKPIQFH